MGRKVQSLEYCTAYFRYFSKPEACIKERTFQVTTGTQLQAWFWRLTGRWLSRVNIHGGLPGGH